MDKKSEEKQHENKKYGNRNRGLKEINHPQDQIVPKGPASEVVLAGDETETSSLAVSHLRHSALEYTMSSAARRELCSSLALPARRELLPMMGFPQEIPLQPILQGMTINQKKKKKSGQRKLKLGNPEENSTEEVVSDDSSDYRERPHGRSDKKKENSLIPRTGMFTLTNN
ncbi:hypothetical protein MJO28_010501 [Puccinia striiformis f. sp. tritici]|uniref:Uncharacterized protein n=1 Tax=Puccinia striiformis f. sp. tritici TaxID=168172 RepID=A0ACC0E5Z3_9BASI|nr:hypothetical protein MJO28_010501 [Puccinia striiformis f. sp. tritici]